jgi:hypothetical protein
MRGSPKKEGKRLRMKENGDKNEGSRKYIT